MLPVEPVCAGCAESAFAVRNGLDDADLVALFAWTEAQFSERMRGSAIRRIGFDRWSRNLAVGLGNAPATAEVIAALEARADDPSPLVREHVAWALARHGQRGDHSSRNARNATGS